MAPVLQCPDCDTKHPLNEVPESGTFPCKGCGRILKVPETVPGRAKPPAPAPAAAGTAAAAATSAAPPRPAPAPNPTVASRPVDVREPTRVMPVVTQNVPPRSDGRAPTVAPAPGRAKVPWWMQLLLWIVAVPLGYFIVFLFARATGFFSSNQLSDVFLANGFSRFWPLARLLPIVALVTAALVQGGVVLLSRRKGRGGAATATRARR